MHQRQFLIGCLAFVCAFAPIASPLAQQRARPSELLQQVEIEHAKLQQAFERGLRQDRAQSDDFEERLAPLVRQTAERTSGYRIADWKGDELLSLGTLYFFAQQYGPAVEAFQSFLGATEIGDGTAHARVRLVRSLIELDRIDEAAAALAEMERVERGGLEMLSVRVIAHRDLAIALRDNQQYEKAAKQATGGFEICRRIPAGDQLPLLLREARDFETPRLAAMAVDLLERMGLKKVSEEIVSRWRSGDRGRPAQAQMIYETELASARLIGKPVPELAAKRWLDSSASTLSAFRGKVVLLHFWAMWNSASASQLPRLREWDTLYADRGLQVIGVTRLYGRSDTEDGLNAARELQSLESLKRKEQITFPFAVAGQDDITDDERFGVASLPMVILIDRQGRVRQIKRGVSEYRKLSRQIDKLIAEP